MNGCTAQVVEVLAGDVQKDQWLMSQINSFVDRGDVLVFANQKTRVDMLCDKLKAAGIRCAAKKERVIPYSCKQRSDSRVWFSCMSICHP